MKKISILAVFAAALLSVDVAQAIPTLTVKNNWDKPIIATATHRFCRFKGKINDLLKLGSEKGTQALAEKLEIAKKAEGKSDTQQKLMQEAKGMWDALVGGKGEACGVEVIEPGKEFKFEVRTGIAGIIKGFSLTINNTNGKEIISKQKDIKRDTIADFDGDALRYIDKNTGEKREKKSNYDALNYGDEAK